MSERKAISRPDIGVDQLQAEFERVRYRKRFRQTLASTMLTLALVAALALAAAHMLLPVMRIHGSSMEHTLNAGDIVVAVKGMRAGPGDIVAFDVEGKLLVKRVIAQAGDVVSIDPNGAVSINGEALSEPYIYEAALGACDMELPCTVPEGTLFLLGDHRSASVDSRSEAIGFVKEEQIIGKVVLRVWPLNRIDWLN